MSGTQSGTAPLPGAFAAAAGDCRRDPPAAPPSLARGEHTPANGRRVSVRVAQAARKPQSVCGAATYGLRRVYWFLANDLRVIGYLNYRLRQVKERPTSRQGHVLSLTGTTVAAFAAGDTRAFSIAHYDTRVKLYVHAEPSLLEEAILVQGNRQYDYALFLESLAQLLTYCKPEVCRAYILVMPHIGQVDAAYFTYMSQLGARFTAPAALGHPEYPFLVRLRERFTAWPNVHMRIQVCFYVLSPSGRGLG
jgi:hypothetical protein